MNKAGNIVIPPQFGTIDTRQLIYDDYSFVRNGVYASFSEGFAAVCEIKQSKCGFIDKSGKVMIPLQFDMTLPFSEELAAIKIGDKFGFVDKTGKLVINPQFDGAIKFSEGLARVVIGKKFGYIDKAGKIVINPQFDYAQDFSKGLAMVAVGERNEGSIGYIDKSGKYIWNPTS